MKIEKLNENQIKCTLTREDLEKRNLQISELAYGSEKTQNLFREMVKQADYEYGFETDNIPLVVEAIPMNKDSIVLIITKIDDPEELDTRFSRFSPYADSDYEDEDFDEETLETSSLSENKTSSPSFEDMLKDALSEQTIDRSFVFGFASISDVMNFSSQVRGFMGESTLYKSDEGQYYIILSAGAATKDEFRNACLIASEYGRGKSIPKTNKEYILDHLDILIAKDAIEKLNGK